MDSEATQGSELLVEAVITRLMPCPEHEAEATDKHVFKVRGVRSYQPTLDETELIILADDAVIVANPNGFRHDCAACQATPRGTERIRDVRSVQ